MLHFASRFFGHCGVKDSALLSEEDGPFFEMFQIIDFNRGFSNGTSKAIWGFIVPVASQMFIFWNQRICTFVTILIAGLGLCIHILSSLTASARGKILILGQLKRVFMLWIAHFWWKPLKRHMSWLIFVRSTWSKLLAKIFFCTRSHRDTGTFPNWTWFRLKTLRARLTDQKFYCGSNFFEVRVGPAKWTAICTSLTPTLFTL